MAFIVVFLLSGAAGGHRACDVRVCANGLVGTSFFVADRGCQSKFEMQFCTAEHVARHGTRAAIALTTTESRQFRNDLREGQQINCPPEKRDGGAGEDMIFWGGRDWRMNTTWGFT
jgi:hypothetical protein